MVVRRGQQCLHLAIASDPAKSVSRVPSSRDRFVCTTRTRSFFPRWYTDDDAVLRVEAGCVVLRE